MQQVTNDTIEQVKRRILPLLKEAGVVRSSLFGSFVRGEQTEVSDIDILIEFPKGKSLLDLVGLEMKLEQAVGRKVDLLTYNSLSPYLRDTIQNTQLPILS
jgi:predicted nucleotidyltransferase